MEWLIVAKMAESVNKRRRESDQFGGLFQQRPVAENFYYKMDSSDTASSSLLLQNQLRQNHHNQQVATNLGGPHSRGQNYDENILLFATEHNQNTNHKGAPTDSQALVSPVRASVRSGTPRNGLGAEGSRRRPSEHHVERARSAAPTGKYVSAYPSSRQPVYEKLAGSGHTGATLTRPYAFHVPAPWQRAHSPSPPFSSSSNLLVQAEGSPSRQQQRPPPLPRTPCIKQARYGYVAASNRVEPKVDHVARFNGSLRSKTIEHIPSMMQVSVEDNCLNYDSQVLVRRAPSEQNVRATNATVQSVCAPSDKHVLPLRPVGPNTLGQENPFKPGTELSWEADLMVRLIKRGYPIGDLNHLVAAAKELKEQDSKRGAPEWRSCDKLPLNNARLARQQQLANGNNRSMSKSHSNLNHQSACGHKLCHEKQLQRDRSREHNSRAATIGGNARRNGCEPETEMAAAESLEKSPKQVWANSLSRAKSIPRSLNYHSSAKKDKQEDCDSLDKLIMNIEQEMYDLLNGNAPDQAKSIENSEATTPTRVLITNGTVTDQQLKSAPRNRRLIQKLAGQQSDGEDGSKSETDTAATRIIETQAADSKNSLHAEKILNPKQKTTDLAKSKQMNRKARRKSDSELLAAEKENTKNNGINKKKGKQCCCIQ